MQCVLIRGEAEDNFTTEEEESNEDGSRFGVIVASRRKRQGTNSVLEPLEVTNQRLDFSSIRFVAHF